MFRLDVSVFLLYLVTLGIVSDWLCFNTFCFPLIEFGLCRCLYQRYMICPVVIHCIFVWLVDSSIVLILLFALLLEECVLLGSFVSLLTLGLPLLFRCISLKSSDMKHYYRSNNNQHFWQNKIKYDNVSSSDCEQRRRPQDSQARALFCSDQANWESKLTLEMPNDTLSYFVSF
jgi:hypothetical protein